MEAWHLIRSGAGAPAWNMALDEALLETAPQRARPALRFYGWTEPAATFGYAQKYSRAAALTQLRPLVRRPTGGGLAPHDADWTYCLVFPPQHDWHRLRAADSYRRLHEWIRAAFARLDVPATLAAWRDNAVPGQCFAGPEKSDLLWQGRKIAGAAQRRTRTGLLIQGSVQPPPLGLARSAWESALCQSLEAEWIPLPDALLPVELARRLEEEKYAQAAFNQKR
jgi:lipoate-protein ligase A